jgi:hypothetical protein
MQKLEDVTTVVIKHKANDSRGVGRIIKKRRRTQTAPKFGAGQEI